MDKLKALFGTEALTYEQLEEKLKDNKEIKLANLAGGGYVDRMKHESEISEMSAKLTTANDTIAGLQDTVKKFDGVDVVGLQKSVEDWKTKYDTDMEAAKVDSLLTDVLIAAKAKNPKMVKKMLDLSLVKRDGEKLLGVTEQLDALKESDGYAFDTEEPGGANVKTGANHNGTNNVDSFMAAFMQGAGLETPKGE